MRSLLSPQFFRSARTLRFRLTVWNTLVVVVALLIALFAVREGLRYYLLIEVDEVLDGEARELLIAIKNDNQKELVIAEMQRKIEAHEERAWFIRWMSEDQPDDIWHSDNSPQEPQTQYQGSSKGHIVWVSASHRTIERELVLPNAPRQYVRVGVPTSFIEDDVERLTRMLAPVGLAIFLLAPLGGMLLAERAIEPLQEIIHTTDRLRPSHLDERLAVRGVGDELDQLASKINTFLDEIATHLQKNSDFVANAAHELRSPLTAIQSMVEVTLDKTRNQAEYEEVLYQINDQCHHLTQVVNQLLQLTQSEAAAAGTRQERVELGDIIARCLEMFDPVAEERSLKLSSDIAEQLAVRGNTREIRQLLTNLIDNAIKFTLAGGSVTVWLGRGDDRHLACVKIKDSGIGIPPDGLPRVFDRFYQVDKSRHRGVETRGNGLGLSICQAIVNAHHGTIRVDSQMGIGTTFTIQLPIAPGSVTAADA